MAATMTTVVKGTEEGGNFFSRMAWYYQMGVLLFLSGLLIFGVHFLLYSDKRAETEKIKDKAEQLKSKNAQGSIILQNLPAVEQTLKEKREEIDRLRDLLPDQVQISSVYDNIKDFLREQELAYLNRALAYTGGDKEKAAELLDISLATLYRKLSEDDAA